MYLKSLKIKNFRKFGDKNNLIKFVDSRDCFGQEIINVASATTLIVGKNNSGKTTITKALDKLINIKKFEANDFNFSYLKKLLDEYILGTFEKFPILEFELLIGLDKTDDLVTNIIPFMNIEDIDKKDFKIKINYELLETTEFIEKIKKIIDGYSDNYIRFQKYLEVLQTVDKKLNYYNLDDEIIENHKFRLSDLIKIKVIAANKTINETSLSTTFNKIIQYKYKTENMDDINQQIDTINEDMTTKVSSTHTPHINGALHAVENPEKLEIKLSSSLDFNILMKEMIRYEYIEKGLCIPEGQFGLGYSNLMSIIGEIIDYIEQYPDDELQSKLNLICIEEPEAFMHPQMQELFIKNINDAVNYLLNGSDKKINSQLIITTHSSHIINSKIHTSNSFDNINYITIIDNLSMVVNLHDKKIINEIDYPDEEEALNQLKFIKKHIKHKVSEVFFSDAIIFVEGITEETLLRYYMDGDSELNRYYVSIFNINGAHGLVYHNLIKLLKIPALIITDLDIKRTENEKDRFLQVQSLESKKTTNNTITKYNGCDNINNISPFFEDENLYITFQSEKILGYFSTSFEEAFILKNYDNNILNMVLKKLKPQIYTSIVGDPENKNKLANNSFKLQKKLSKSKSDFANELLYQLSINSDNEINPSLPKYIEDAIDWLKIKLKSVDVTQEVVS